MAGERTSRETGRPGVQDDSLFRAAFDTASHGMAIVGIDGRFVEANNACGRILGYSSRELQQRDFQSITHPDDLDADLDHVRRLLAGEASGYQMEKRYFHRAGHVVWAQLDVALIRDHANKPLYFISQIQDVTARKQADEALRQAEQRFRSLVSNLPGVVYRSTMSAAGEVRDTYVSPHVTGMLGVSPEALSAGGLRLLDFVHPDDLDRMLKAMGRCARELRPASIELRKITRPDGVVRWWDVHMTPRLGLDGAVEFDSIALDITDHKAAEDRLRLRERALDSISQAITIADAARPDFPIIYVNPAFERITGYAAEEAIGRNCRFLQGTATDPATVARIRSVLFEGEPFHGEIVNHRKDGATFYNELSITPVRDPAGRLTHFVGVMADVTARHNLEAQLRQALKIEAVGKLTGGVAHDFNNLLMVAHGNLELLSEALATGNSQVEEFVDQAQKAVLRGAELTQRLLAFARLQPQRAGAVDVNQLITELAPLLRRTLGEHIQIKISLAEKLWPASIDRSQAENALLNLAVNARDAMPSGGRLTISTSRTSLDREGLFDLPRGDYLLISVTDTGEGMPKEVMERAFEPFFTTKEVGKGTGLGLSMVYGFARQAGGHVALSSKPGKGTTVSLYLPRVRADAQARGDARQSPSLPFGSERILLVEDDAAVRGTVRLMLEDFGYRVTEVGDGQAALAVLKRDPGVDLILTDLVMPGSINGWQLALDVWEKRPQQKVLFSTGYSDNPIIQQASRDTRIHVLRKPFGRRDLAEAVRATLDEAH
jgi:two-component system, cell cycle sensor histidine kinase and response regulator CckA